MTNRPCPALSPLRVYFGIFIWKWINFNPNHVNPQTHTFRQWKQEIYVAYIFMNIGEKKGHWKWLTGFGVDERLHYSKEVSGSKICFTWWKLFFGLSFEDNNLNPKLSGRRKLIHHVHCTILITVWFLFTICFLSPYLFHFSVFFSLFVELLYHFLLFVVK